MKLTLLPTKSLRQKSEEVIFPLDAATIELAEAMIKHIADSKDPNTELRDGVGIAAPQLGINKRMFYINTVEDSEGTVFEELLINPVVLAESAQWAALEGGEGCLSVPPELNLKTDGLIHRRNIIKIRGYSYLQKKEVTITKIGYPAIVIQHEYDHLNGVLFLDKIQKGKEWDQKKDEVLI